MMQFIKNTYRNNQEKILLIICSIIVVTPLLFTAKTPAIIGYTEFHLLNTAKITALFSSWQTLNLGQSGAANLWRLFPLDTFYYFLNYGLKIIPQVTQALFISLISLSGFLSFYFLMKELAPKVLIHARLIGALIFIFNVYNLINISSSFVFAIVYFALPLQVLILIRGLHAHKYLQPSILLAVVNMATFGVNLAYSVIAVALIISVGLWEVLVLKIVKFKSLLCMLTLTGLFTLFLIAWWLLPMLIAALGDSQTTSFILSSETFNGLDSTPLNIFRNLGDWSFFSGYQGVAYHRFAYEFKNNFLVLATSFTPSLLVLISLLIVYSKRFTDSLIRKRLLFLYLIIFILLPVIGNTNPNWPTYGLLNWIFKNIPFSMAFRSTYKFTELVEFFYAIILTVFIDYIYRKAKVFKHWRMIITFGGLFLAVILVSNTFPFWFGNLYENKSQISALPNYWTEMSNYVNENLKTDYDRILLLPNQYFPVFQWNSTQRALPSDQTEITFNPPTVHGTCKGCAPPASSQLLDFIYSNISQLNIAEFLGTINISSILQRNDFDYKYYNQPSPSQIKTILTSNPNVKLKKTIGKLDLYTIDKAFVNPRIYSPSIMTSVDSLSDALNSFNNIPYANLSNAFKIDQHNKSDFKYAADSNQYLQFYQQALSYISKNTINQNISLDANTELHLISGNDAQKSVILTKKSDNVKVSLGDNESTLLKKGSYNVSSSFSIGSQELLSNGSFENGLWRQKVGDCDLEHPNAVLNMSRDNDASQGRYSMRLSANADTACSYSPKFSQFNKNQDYLVTFDYKILKGDGASYCLWDNNQCLNTAPLTGTKTGTWYHAQIPVKTLPTSSSLSIYLYAAAEENGPTTVLYDNVSAHTMTNQLINNFALLPTTIKTISSLHLNIHKDNDSRYVLRTKLTKTESTVIFQEAYSPGWRVYVVPDTSNPTKLLDYLTFRQQGYELPTGDHYVANGFANGWWINGNKIPDKYKSKNQTYTIVLEYWPQRYFYFGTAISSVALLFCLGYLSRYYYQRRAYTRRVKRSADRSHKS